MIEITNLGPRTMEMKTATFSAGGRTWILWAPDQGRKTRVMAPGESYARDVDWDFVKYPVFGPDTSQPTDFFVEIETTRTVHRRHVDVREVRFVDTLDGR